jgi:hypothetical protein
MKYSSRALHALVRKMTGKIAAATFLTLNGKLRAVSLQHMLDDGEPQP